MIVLFFNLFLLLPLALVPCINYKLSECVYYLRFIYFLLEKSLMALHYRPAYSSDQTLTISPRREDLI